MDIRLFASLFSSLLASLLCLLLHGLLHTAQAATATVAAASTLRPALEVLGTQFTRETGHLLKVVYGASGNFYSQIRQGAPFDLFLSADMEFPERLVREKLAPPPVVPYAKGRLVLMWHNSTILKSEVVFSDLGSALTDGRVKKFSIANPELAPYGQRAREVLERAGLLQLVQPRLVTGENIGQATQFVASGAAQAGLVALSLALVPEVQKTTRHVLVPEDQHRPIQQGMLLLKPGNTAASAFADYLKKPEARLVFKKYGYD